MQKWVCAGCGYVCVPAKGDPDGAVKPEMSFQELPDDWVRPVRGPGPADVEKAQD
jgi:rubredoxin